MKKIFILLIIQLCVLSIYAQDRLITGTIYDETGASIIGAYITLAGTSNATMADLDGNYSIKVPQTGEFTLVFTSLGYVTKKVVVSNATNKLDITLEVSTENLDEIVVIGYGSQKKATVTGSLSSVSADELVEQPVSDVTQALAGRLPGLIANQAGGRPGEDASTIKIRGIATLDAGAGSNPLILIDGVERDQSALSFLDPNEIQSLSILKDASSTAVFGVRGANGVILVETKRGKVGPAKMVYKGSMAVLVPDKSIDVLDSYIQTGLLNEYQGYGMNSTDPTAPYPQSVRDRYKGVIDGNPINPSDPFFYPSTNYMDEMLGDYALQTQHNFTVSGGTEKLKYFVSLGYYNQGGMFKNVNPDLDKSTSYSRYNYRTNIDINLTKTTLAKINIGGSFNESTSLGQNGTEPSQSFYWNLLNHASPWDGYLYDNKLVMLQENANSVLLNSDMRGYNIDLQNTADYTFIIDQDLDAVLKGLSAKATVSLVSFFRNTISRAKDEKSLPYWSPVLNADETVSFYQAKEDILPYNSTRQYKTRKEYYEFALNYKRNSNSNAHKFTALALFNAEKSHYTLSQYYAVPRAYLGVVGRATYNYMNKYLLEFNVGYNGSENFAEGQRFGVFPAYSAGWTFTEEQWLKNVIGENILSYGKLRFSYGTVGNDKMGGERFLYLPDTYTIGSNYIHQNVEGASERDHLFVFFGPNGELVNYPLAKQGRAGNPNVTWEKSVKVNYGADLFFLGDLISVKFDYFTENRTDILIDQEVVPIYQQSGELALNLGQVENKGYEIELSLNKQVNENLRIWADLNYTHAENKIIEMDEPDGKLSYRQQTGTKVGELWGYQQDGYFETEEAANAYREQLWTRYSELNPGADKNAYEAYMIYEGEVGAGDLKFIDRNNDGRITPEDAGYLGTPSFPETMFGIKLGMKYKNFSFSALFQGASDYAINVRTNNSPNPNKGSLLSFVENRYTPERYEAGETIEFPRLTKDNDNWKTVGTFWLRDASYLRLKNVEVAYTFSKKQYNFIKRVGLDNLRVYANGANLLTLSQIEYLDPETTNGVLRYPRSRTINLGLQVQF